MKTKKLLIVLSLSTALQLNSASPIPASERLTDELLGVGKSSLRPAEESTGCKGGHHHRRGMGLEDSDQHHVEYIKKWQTERHRRDYNDRCRNMSWPCYFSNLLKNGFYYLFGSEKIPAPQPIAPDSEDLSAVSGTVKPSVPLGTSPATSTAVVCDVLNGMTFKSSEIVYDQGDINGCTANALGFIIRYWGVKNGKQPTNFTSSNPDFLYPSRYYNYYNSLAIAGKLGANVDAMAITAGNVGAPVSAERALLSLDKYGICPEKVSVIKLKILGDSATDLRENSGNLIVDNSQVFEVSMGMDYLQDSVTKQIKPSLLSYLSATVSLAAIPGINISDASLNAYQSVAQKIRYNYLGNSSRQFRDLTPFKNALASGYPIFFGARLYSAFMDPTINGSKAKFFVPMPAASEASAGGHAMVIVGWGNFNSALPAKNYFKVLNSWGPDWADNGFCYFPEEYIMANTVSAYSVWFTK
jgi:hypothetical protein